MFCRTCGQKNKDYSIYCSKDGTMLHTFNAKVNLIRDDAKFCGNCGNPIKSYDLYCKNCGVSLFKESKKTTIFQKPVTRIPKQVSIGKTDIKTPIINSLIAFGIVFIFCLVVSSAINSSIREVLADELGIYIDVKIFNPLDLSLLFNLSSLKLSMGVNSDYGSYSYAANIAGRFFLFLLVPFIIFFILGIINGKKDVQEGKEFNYKNYLLTGLFYGLILSIVSLLSRNTVSTPGFDFGEIISLNKRFSFFNTFINGGLISILSSLMGYGVYARASKKEFITGNFKWMFDGLFIFFVSGIIISVVSSIFLSFVPDIESGIGFLDLTLFSQFGIYAFLLMNFGSLTVVENNFVDKISLLWNLDFVKDNFESGELVLLYIPILLPIVLFFIYGRRAKKASSSTMIYTILTYSIAMAMLAYLTNIKITGWEVSMLDGSLDYNIGIGISFISSLIGSFILSGISVAIGYLLSKKEAKSSI